MSLYRVIVSTTTVGLAGSTTLLVSGDFPHISDATKAINEWAKEQYHGEVTTQVAFLNHSDEIFVGDLLNSNYHKVVILR